MAIVASRGGGTGDFFLLLTLSLKSLIGTSTGEDSGGGDGRAVVAQPCVDLLHWFTVLWLKVTI